MTIPSDLRYSEDHEWARVEGDVVTVGVTHHAQDALGDIVFVELPDEGREVTQGEAFGVVESVKAVSDLFAPISGTVKERNEPLLDAPETVNKDPYGDGWMVKITVADQALVEQLLDANAYQALLDKEAK